MYCKFQVYAPSTNTWSDFGKVCSPLNIGESIKADLQAAYSIKLYFNPINTVSLVPGTFCRINMNTRTFEFVIIDGGSIDPVGPAGFCYHVYSVQELLAATRNISIQKAFFTVGLYTLTEFTTRLTALCKSSVAISWDTTNAGWTIMLANWNKSDYQVTSTALLDNLIKIGQNLQVRLKARVYNSGIQIYAVNLKGDGAADFSGGKFNGKSTSYSGANYASKIVAKAENVTVDQYIWFPIHDQYGGITPRPSDDGSVMTEDKMTLVLPFKIKACSLICAIGFDRLVRDSLSQESAEDYRYYDMDGNQIIADTGKYLRYRTDITGVRNYQSVGNEYHVYEYKDWLLLDPDSTNGATYHQGNTCYFKSFENKIYNISICAGNGAMIYERRVYDQYGTVIDTTYKPQFMIAHLNNYELYGNFAFDPILEKRNNLAGERAEFYSQEENTVSGRVLSDNMQGMINSMNNADFTLSYIFDDIDSVPVVGQTHEGMVISDVNMKVAFSKISATFRMSDALVSKSEYISPYTGTSLAAITLDKIFNRSINYISNLVFCESLAKAQAILALYGASQVNINAVRLAYLLATPDAFRENYPRTPMEMALKLGTESFVYTAGSVICAAVGNSLLVNFKTEDNVIIGYLIDRTAGDAIDKAKYYPVAFVGDEIIEKTAKFKCLCYSLDDASPNYPAISQSRFDSAFEFFTIDDENFYHDPAESINVTVEFNLVSHPDYPSSKVDQNFIEESDFFKDTKTGPSTGIIYIKQIGISSPPPLPTSTVTVTEVSEGIFLYSILVLETSGWVDGSNKAVQLIRSDATEHVMMQMLGKVKVDAGNTYLQFYIANTK